MSHTVNEDIIVCCLAKMPKLFGSDREGTIHPQIGTKQPDLLFITKRGEKLYVEVKKAQLKPGDITQLISYHKEILENEYRSNIKLMVIASEFSEDDSYHLDRFDIKKRILEEFKVKGTLQLDFTIKVDTDAVKLSSSIESSHDIDVLDRLYIVYPDQFNQIMEQLGCKKRAEMNRRRNGVRSRRFTEQERILMICLVMDSEFIEAELDFLDYVRPSGTKHEGMIFKDSRGKKLYVVAMTTPFEEKMGQINKYYCHIRDSEERGTRLMVIGPQFSETDDDFLNRHNVEKKTLEFPMQGTLKLDFTIKLDTDEGELRISIDVPSDVLDRLLDDWWNGLDIDDLCDQLIKQRGSIKFIVEG